DEVQAQAVVGGRGAVATAKVDRSVTYSPSAAAGDPIDRPPRTRSAALLRRQDICLERKFCESHSYGCFDRLTTYKFESLADDAAQWGRAARSRPMREVREVPRTATNAALPPDVLAFSPVEGQAAGAAREMPG